MVRTFGNAPGLKQDKTVQKWSFSLTIFPVNKTKSAGNCKFCHI